MQGLKAAHCPRTKFTFCDANYRYKHVPLSDNLGQLDQLENILRTKDT